MNEILIKIAECMKEGKNEEALYYNKKLIDKEPKLPHHYFNHGLLLRELDRHEEAIEFMKNAKALKPNCPVIRYLLSDSLLATGKFREGLGEYEWRFKFPLKDSYCPNALFQYRPQIRQMYKKPYWDGKKQNKTILVFNEAGFGDYINYIRYVKEISKQNCTPIIEVSDDLAQLFKSLNVEIVLKNKEDKLGAWVSTFARKKIALDLPDHDYVVSVNSLPYLFDPDMKQIEDSPYLFLPEEYNPNEVIKQFDDKFKIGITWAGRKEHDNDCYRSLYLREFKPLSDLPGVQLFAIQKGNMERIWNEKSVNLLEGTESMSVVDMCDYLENFYETAKILKELDLFISIDSSPAHLAGAIGCPTFLILPLGKRDWRWQKQWYKSVEIVEQKEKGNWIEVIECVKKKIKNLLDNRIKKI